MSSYTILTYSAKDPAIKPYINMIHSDWKQSLRYGNFWFRLIDKDAFYKTYDEILLTLLNRPDTVIRLACLSDELDTCLGWSLTEGTKLHYVFVKEPYRSQNIGASLMPKDFDQVTHLTKTGYHIRKAKFPKIPFNPFFQ